MARAIPTDKQGTEATAAVVIGSVLPDADNIVSLLGSEYHLRFHRGLSHSFAGVAVSSLLVALLLYRFGKWKDLKKLYLLVLVGQFSHIALDLLNSFGTQIFQPFSDARMSFDLLFIVDLAFTGIIVAGLFLSRYHPSRARAALLVLCSYVGFAAFLHMRAEEAVRVAALRQGVPVVSSWALPRLSEVPDSLDLTIGRRAEAAQETGNGGGFPLPAGPFAWNGFVDDGRTYLRAEVDPVGGTVSWKERALKGQDTREVQALRDIPDVRTYLWFARFPAVNVTTEGEKTIVTFYDMRFRGIAGRHPFVLRVIETPGRSPRAQWGGG